MTRYETPDGLPGLALAEWETGSLPGIHLTPRDARLVEQVARGGSDVRTDVRGTGAGVEVTSRGSVGLLRFEQFEVRINPKLAGGHAALFRMVEYAAGLKGLSLLKGLPHLGFEETHLVDLIVEMLVRHADRLLRAGLRADYVERVDHLPAVRGRFLPDRQELDRLGLIDRLVCRFDELEQDIPDNQLLALGLARGARVARDRRIRARTAAQAALLQEVCEPSAFPITRRSDVIQYDRMNEHYQSAHVLCHLLLDDAGPNEALSGDAARVNSFRIDMHEVFEAFLERVLRETIGAEVTVSAQQQGALYWDEDRGSAYSDVRPDLLLETRRAPKRRVAVDAKYKLYSAKGTAGRRVESGDLAQAFVYAYAHRDSQRAQPAAAIIFPVDGPRKRGARRLEVRRMADGHPDARIFTVGIHIPSVLDEVIQKSGKTPVLDELRTLLRPELDLDIPA